MTKTETGPRDPAAAAAQHLLQIIECYIYLGLHLPWQAMFAWAQFLLLLVAYKRSLYELHLCDARLPAHSIQQLLCISLLLVRWSACVASPTRAETVACVEPSSIACTTW